MEKNNDQMQEIRMCFQTYFNMYGTVPSEQEMLEWLGTSYENEIPKYMNGMMKNLVNVQTLDITLHRTGKIRQLDLFHSEPRLFISHMHSLLCPLTESGSISLLYRLHTDHTNPNAGRGRISSLQE